MEQSHKCPTCGQSILAPPPDVAPPTPVAKQPKKTLRYTREVTTFLLSGETHSVRDKIKAIPGHMWFADKKQWRVPANETSAKMLEDIISFQLSSP